MSSYPRRSRYAPPPTRRSTSFSDDDSVRPPPSSTAPSTPSTAPTLIPRLSPRSPSPLAPPRPAFLRSRPQSTRSGSSSNSYSYSQDSQTASLTPSVDTPSASDSEREMPPVVPPRARQRAHNRGRVGAAGAAAGRGTGAGAAAGGYTALNADAHAPSPAPTPNPNPNAALYAIPASASASLRSATELPATAGPFFATSNAGTASDDDSVPSVPLAPSPRTPPSRAHPPPSSFPLSLPPAFPFQAYPGNPDPGTPVPVHASAAASVASFSRRASLESLARARTTAGAGAGAAIVRPGSASGSESHAPHLASATATAAASPYYHLAQSAVRRRSLDTDASADGPPPAGGARAGGSRASWDAEFEREVGARVLAPFARGDGFNVSAGPSPGPAAFGVGVGVGVGAGAYGFGMGGPGVGVGVGIGAAPAPGTGSTPSFRAPFLSPASRPSSSLWSPPAHAFATAPPLPHAAGTGTASVASLPLPGPKPPRPTTLLARKLSTSDKPWLHARERHTALGWWATAALFFAGVGLAGVLCWRGYVDAGAGLIDPQNLCSVVVDEFDSADGSVDGSIWDREVELGGFGNGEFQMTTASSKNLFTRNGELYILPTLTSDEIGYTSGVLAGYTYDLPGCTSTNASACAASSVANNSVVNPVQSARLTTRKSYSIRYGRIEVRAKMPQGDWLWPAVWMLPVKDVYGAWPVSGEIDILEARGNAPSYPAQGNNVVRSTLAWGPLPALVARLYGWQARKRAPFAAGFHTYALEWTPDFVRAYVDSRLHAMLDLRVGDKGGFWAAGKFPATAVNGSAEVVVQDPYQGSASAPFDQNFYLILDLAVGGTSGWFPDNVGGKMWYDGSASAMVDFAKAQSTWYATWPASDDDRALRIDYVKMWQLC